ncbi:MAG: DUF5615 family PIN-like protein [Bacillota bacterium]
MNFVADESVDRDIVIAIRSSGHMVTYVAEMEPGITDEAVLNLANKLQAVLITSDKDFGEIVFRQGRVAAGVVLVRLMALSQETKARLVAGELNKHLDELRGAFSVITRNRLRIRKLR